MASNSIEWRWVGGVALCILAISIAPNLFGYLVTPPDLHYTGLAYNWQDANSYLAKMMQGVRGEWLYRVPFTTEPGDGVFLYPNYLLFGHIAAWTGLEPVIIFQLARLAGGAVLLVTLYAFASRFFVNVRERRLGFLLAAIGSGFGWLPLLFNTMTPDILNAEIFPFLAMLTNPHFPLAMAAELWVVDALIPATRLSWPHLVIGTLILALTQPYGLVSAGGAALAWMAIRWLRERRWPLDALRALLLMLALATPVALYDAWALTNNAALTGWNQQNVTLSPPLWQWLVAGGLVLALAVMGYGAAWQRVRRSRRLDANDGLLLLWVAAIALLVALPGAQQRRFAFGLFIPLAILAVQALPLLGRFNAPLTRALLVGVSALTNVVLIVIAFATMTFHQSFLFFSAHEWHALLYLRAANPHALVLASPEMGLYIPAWAGQRVIYGHPHETANAKARASEVQQFFAGKLTSDAFLARVDYIFVGPRERALGAPIIPPSFAPVFNDGEVTIYANRARLATHE